MDLNLCNPTLCISNASPVRELRLAAERSFPISPCISLYLAYISLYLRRASCASLQSAASGCT